MVTPLLLLEQFFLKNRFEALLEFLPFLFRSYFFLGTKKEKTKDKKRT